MDNFSELMFSNMRTLYLLSFLINIPIMIICGFVGKSLFEKKGRSAASGFALGFFLNVTGIIICVVLPDSPSREMERMQAIQRNFPPVQTFPVPTTVLCKSCGTGLVPDSTFCHACGAKVSVS